MDRDLYRRRQRRRAIVAWGTFAIVAALVAVGAIFGGGKDGRSGSSTTVRLFSAQMSSQQYEAIHRGQSESLVLNRLGNVGLQEDEVEGSSLISLFPPRPDGSTCSYWTLSDAPAHLVRLCFSDPKGVLLQKSVAAGGGDGAPSTLA